MILILLILVIFQSIITQYFTDNPDFYQLGTDTWESDDFRAMRLGEGVCSMAGLDGEAVAALMIQHDYDLRALLAEDLSWDPSDLLSRRPGDYQRLSQAYETVFQDLQCFPVPVSLNPDTPDITYEDGWQDSRTFPSSEQTGGEAKGTGRVHEGCDLMGEERPSGFYPVVSISDGIIEQEGWLTLGGWRLGIRSPGGLYIYYAHLNRYARDWKAGDSVAAGELLGYMGDSGYGEKGTVGKFPVHLHLGIYMETDHYDEMSVNPYWLLRFLEKKRLVYQY